LSKESELKEYIEACIRGFDMFSPYSPEGIAEAEEAYRQLLLNFKNDVLSGKV
jgi:hypothetical protein